MILWLCSLKAYSQVGIGITVDPRTIDNLGEYDITKHRFAPLPTDRFPIGIEITRHRDDKRDRIRYRIDGMIARNRDRSSESLLDDDLLPVGSQRIDNVETSTAIGLRMAIEQEYLIGDECYGLLWGRGLSAAASRNAYERTTNNPLGAYAGDTLEYDSRYRFAAGAYLHVGAFYNYRDLCSVSLRGAAGIRGTYRPSEEFLYVKSESGLPTLISSQEQPVGDQWTWSILWRPSFVFTVYF